MTFTVSYQPERRDAVSGDTIAELRDSLREVECLDSVQVQLDQGQLGACVLAYFNAHRAWMIWLGTEGEGLHPVSARRREAEQGEEDCFLGNGQLDCFLVRDGLSKSEAVQVLMHFFERGEMAPWLQWTEGS